MISLLALTTTAAAVDVTTCTGTLESVTGLSTPVSGFGATEAEARRSVRQSARVLTDQRLILEASLAWLGSSTPSSDNLATWVGARGTPELAAPGWTLTPGECTTAPSADGPAWSARWSAGSEAVTRAHPADALEAARRRACFTLYQVSFMQTAKKLEDGTPAAEVLSPLVGAWDQLGQCMTQTAPPVDAIELRGPDSKGPARCAAIGPDATPVGVGFGSTAERAAEDALRQALVARSRLLVGQMGRVRVVDPPEERAPKLQALLSHIATFTGASDVVDRARLACSTVSEGPVKWRPTGRREKDCNGASWTERPSTDVAAADAGSFLDTTCTLQVDPTMQIVRFSLRGAEGEKRDTLVGSAFRVSSDCEAACYSDASWGKDARPFTLAGVADRTDKRKVVASLQKAAKGGAPLAGLELLPTEQAPEALGALFSGATWEKLKTELGTLANQADRWMQIEGHWILKL